MAIIPTGFMGRRFSGYKDSAEGITGPLKKGFVYEDATQTLIVVLDEGKQDVTGYVHAAVRYSPKREEITLLSTTVYKSLYTLQTAIEITEERLLELRDNLDLDEKLLPQQLTRHS